MIFRGEGNTGQLYYAKTSETDDAKLISALMAERDVKYYCPSCNNVMRVRHYTKNDLWGFAHARNTAEKRAGYDCFERFKSSARYANILRDDDITDTSEWHTWWQGVFKEAGFEIEHTEKDARGKCRADAIDIENKRVVEFQHSPLDIATFNRRNEFWVRRGYSVTWLFDVTDRFEHESIRYYREKNGNQLYRFYGYTDMLGEYDPKIDLNIRVYLYNVFYNKTTGKDEERIRRLSWVRDDYGIVTLGRIRNDCDGFIELCKDKFPLVPNEEISKRRDEKEGRIKAAEEERAKKIKAERKAKEAAEAEKKRQEEEQRQREAEEKAKAEAEAQRKWEEEQEAREAREAKRRNVISGVKDYLVKNGVMRGDQDPYFLSNEIITAVAGKMGIELSKEERTEYATSFAGFISKGERDTRAYLEDIPETVFSLAYDDFIKYLMQNKPFDIVLIEREALKKYNRRKQLASRTATPQTMRCCKKCGKPLVKKTNRQTGESFWGCPDRACWSKR